MTSTRSSENPRLSISLVAKSLVVPLALQNCLKRARSRSATGAGAAGSGAALGAQAGGASWRGTEAAYATPSPPVRPPAPHAPSQPSPRSGSRLKASGPRGGEGARKSHAPPAAEGKTDSGGGALLPPISPRPAKPKGAVADAAGGGRAKAKGAVALPADGPSGPGRGGGAWR